MAHLFKRTVLLPKSSSALNVGNIHMSDGLAVPEGRCTMCYRCINRCPKQAITLLGKEVVEQTTIEKYLKQ